MVEFSATRSLVTFLLLLDSLCCGSGLIVTRFSVEGFFGIAATAAAKELSHTIQFGVTLAMITNLAQYVLHKCFKRHNHSHWNRFGPFYLCAAGVPLIMMDNTRHILQGTQLLLSNTTLSR